MPALLTNFCIQSTHMEQPIDHNELDASLRRCGSNWNASQAHGLLCSRLTVIGVESASMWVAQVLAGTDPDNPAQSECEAMLVSLCSLTWRHLVEGQSEFNLLLPDEEDSAEFRVAAMGYWCEGFLHGLVTEKHSEKLKKRLAAEPLADIIKDMLEITRVTVGDDATEDDDENAFTELVEYLRVAVQLAYEELVEFRAPSEDSLPDDTDTLH